MRSANKQYLDMQADNFFQTQIQFLVYFPCFIMNDMLVIITPVSLSSLTTFEPTDLYSWHTTSLFHDDKSTYQYYADLIQNASGLRVTAGFAIQNETLKLWRGMLEKLRRKQVLVTTTATLGLRSLFLLGRCSHKLRKSCAVVNIYNVSESFLAFATCLTILILTRKYRIRHQNTEW